MNPVCLPVRLGNRIIKVGITEKDTLTCNATKSFNRGVI